MTITSIDVSKLETEEDFHKLLGFKWGFPSYYGQNLDALFDMLTGWVELPLCVEFVGWSEFETAIGQDKAGKILSCFGDADQVTVQLGGWHNGTVK